MVARIATYTESELLASGRRGRNLGNLGRFPQLLAIGNNSMCIFASRRGMLDLVMDASSFQEGLAGMVLFTAIAPIFCLIQWAHKGYCALLISIRWPSNVLTTDAICSLSETGYCPYSTQWLKILSAS
ncbi:hypothetical protein LMTR3_07900 [Bradyrhizobium sp. LMTR 3]|nr:hypothetical protein LMTR3_07900 [Bradyrhizobium sp. LMTR 3]